MTTTGKIREDSLISQPFVDWKLCHSTAYCPIPPGGFNGLHVGEHPIEIRVPCAGSDSFTTNRVPFFVTQVFCSKLLVVCVASYQRLPTQTPVIEDFGPKQGAEIGGVTVTVRGNDFNGGTRDGYFCSFGDIDEVRRLLLLG